MRIFNHFNQYGDECPFCLTKDDRATILIPIPNTENDDNTVVQARQVHWDCWMLNQREVI